MKRKIFAGLAILALALLVPVGVFASSDEFNQLSVLSADEVVDGDYFAVGEIVEISGTVNGDVYAAGGQVLVNGTINGDLMVAGGVVGIGGVVTQDVRAAGGNLVLTGEVGKNVTILGGSIELTEAAVINGSLVTAGGNVNVNTPVVGNIKAGVGNLTLSNDVGGKVEAGVVNLRVSSTASIGGDLVYFSEEDSSISDTASIGGVVEKRAVPKMMREAPNQKDVDNFFAGISVFTLMVSMASSLLLGLVIIHLFPNYTERVSKQISGNFVRSLGVGFLALIAAPIILILLFVTIIGIPIAVVLGMLLFIYLYVARIYAMYAFGSKLVSVTGTKLTNMKWVFVIGLVVYYILSLIPIIGGFVKMFVLLASFGAVLMSDRKMWKEARKAKIF